jgi:diaminohydroxyphosphoribosylaminopyrimidine deaminase/5-amino-6-(5-phosphoribosylamino)uracil reductase
MNLHEKYMERCLELAMKGFGKVAPNPMVGCVIVHKNKIIGEGYHQQYGSAHAEVNAIKSVKTHDLASLRKAILYINLEPCSHFGKTPPCADLIIKTGIKYVVIGNVDPNPLVKGKGLQKLVSAGCDVKVGILEDECRELNKRFFTFHEKQRPFVILKWAQTADKYIGKSEVRSQKSKVSSRIKISSSASQKLVHRWRGEEQAIMVGTNTALTDNPKLTVRDVKGGNPVRILIDRQLKVPSVFHLLDGSVPTIVFTAKKKTTKKKLDYVTIDFNKDVLKQILAELYSRKIQSLIVEGGSTLLNSFIQKNLWDEARVLTSNKIFSQIAEKKASARPGRYGQGVEAPRIAGKVMGQKKSGDDLLLMLSNIS